VLILDSYLDNFAETDDNSIAWVTSLSEKNPTWYTRNGSAPKAAQDLGPLLVDRVVTTREGPKTVHSIPADIQQSPFEKTIKPAAGTDQVRVLTVGKLGDWHGSMQQLTYPVMIIDPVRDLLLNLLWQLNASKGDGLGLLMYTVNKLLSDDFQKNWYFKQFGVTPVAWASRHTLVKAIAFAQKSVVICQQCIVQTQSAKDGEFLKIVDSINSSDKLGIKKEDRWDA